MQHDNGKNECKLKNGVIKIIAIVGVKARLGLRLGLGLSNCCISFFYTLSCIVCSILSLDLPGIH